MLGRGLAVINGAAVMSRPQPLCAGQRLVSTSGDMAFALAIATALHWRRLPRSACVVTPADGSGAAATINPVVNSTASWRVVFALLAGNAD
jgi:hypothetical protein